jgi:putative transposase
VFWTQLHRVAAPFGELAWDHARTQLPRATEEQVADAVEDLLRRAYRGPERTADARERRVAARTRSTADPAWPRPEPPVESAAPVQADAEGTVAFELFDPYQEAQRRW